MNPTWLVNLALQFLKHEFDSTESTANHTDGSIDYKTHGNWDFENGDLIMKSFSSELAVDITPCTHEGVQIWWNFVFWNQPLDLIDVGYDHWVSRLLLEDNFFLHANHIEFHVILLDIEVVLLECDQFLNQTLDLVNSKSMIFVIAIHSSNGQEQEQNEYCESYVVNVQKWRQFMDKSIREIEKL